MLDDVLDFLPPDLDASSVRALALVPRAFDRPTGQVLLLATRDGRRAVLSRPSDFELFREIPALGGTPFSLARVDGTTRLEVHVVDGRVLRLELLEEEVPAVEEIFQDDAHDWPSAETPHARAARRASVRPPESAEAEIVMIPDHILKKDATPVPEPIRGAGAVEDLARKILEDAAPASGPRPSPRPSPRPPRQGGDGHRPRSPRPQRGPTPEPRARFAPPEREERDSSVPQALTPSHEALARARGETLAESARHDSVRPPAFTPQPLPAVSSPRDTVALRARLRQHWERGELDEASQVARLLVFLGSSDPTEKRLAGLAGELAPMFSTALSGHLFKAYVAHEDEDPDLARFCAALWPALLTMRLRPERELGLRARDEVDVAHAESGIAGAFRRAARALALPAPRLWVRADIPGGLAHLNVSPAGSLSGGSLTSGFSTDELLFLAAHHLAFYRPEVYLLALLPSPQDLLTLACAGLVLERRMVAEPRVAKVAESLERFMVPQVRASLHSACAELMLPGDPRSHLAGELERFRRAAHVSALRAGFALTGSISIAARMTNLMPPLVGVDKEDLIDDLATYAVSTGWLTLRRELGIALAPSAPEIPI